MLNVNRSSYYKHYSSKPAARTIENQEIASKILLIYAQHKKRIGAYKTTYILERDYGIKVSLGRVYRLMKKLDLPKMSTDKPRIKKADEEAGNCEDNLKREFNQKAPNLVWVSDITYLKAGGRWYYLCIIMDLFSRKIIAWELSDNLKADLATSVFKKAYDKRKPESGLMFHSDRGTQYTSKPFRQLLDSLNVVQSFSNKGNPFDNACCECFFKYLKKEETNRKTYSSFEELRLSVFEYIEGYYNGVRPHGTLNMMTPNEKEASYFKK